MTVKRQMAARGDRQPGKGLRVLLAVLTVLLLSHAFMPAARAENLKKVSFLPQWFPQAQFAGYYVALEKEIYKKHGIDLKMLRGGPERTFRDSLLKGEADFATQFLSTGIEQRSKGLPVVNIGQIVQRSGLMLVARKADGIITPQDLQGRKVSLWKEFQLQPLAFFRKNNVNVHVIPQTYTLNLFLRGGVDAASAMWYNEFHSLLNAGLDEDELTTFFFDRDGLNFPEDGIYCLEGTCRRDRALCCAFAKASVEGWRYAFDHPEEALDIVMKYVNEAKINTGRIHQKWMFERIRDMILLQDKDRPIGSLHPADYETVSGELRSAGMIRKIPPYGEFYVDCAGEN